MSHVTAEVFQLTVDCGCGWAGKIATYREHLVREHCNVDGCTGLADALVSFGYRNPGLILIGTRLGICRRHRLHLRPGRMHMIVEDLRAIARR